jgi:alkaline phosphatase D
MGKVLTIIAVLLLTAGQVSAQRLIQAGPMQGYTELRTARIWVELAPEVETLNLRYSVDTTGAPWQNLQYNGKLGKEFNPVTFELTALEPGTAYRYKIKAEHGKNSELITGKFRTQEQWVGRKPAPDFSFLAGSCSYFNEPRYERPGNTYGGDSSIFLTMMRTPADFMLWLGDNWYTRDVDYYSRWGLWHRAHYDRSQPVLQPLLMAMPHYAIWDDHDFGPNNFGASYVYKNESRRVFKNYWANPSYGMDGKGIYTQFAYGDVAFFLLDDRTWRSSDDMKDSIDRQPNPEKTMLGAEQMRWLKDALLQSRYSTFKIIAIGSQVLNTYSPFDCFYHYPVEYKELLDFIADNHINGVLFMTGDRHHSEIIKMDRPGHYTLYDITTSPLTSKVYAADGPEKDIPTRVLKVDAVHNYSKVTVSGPAKARKLTVTYYDKTGKELGKWTVTEQELKDN